MAGKAENGTSWTDDRMDDLARRVDQGFAQVDRRFAQVHAEIGGLRSEVQAGIGGLRSEVQAQVGGIRQGQSELRAELRGESREATKQLGDEIRAVGAAVESLQDKFLRLQNVIIAGLLGGIFTLVVGALSILAAIAL